MHQLPVHFAIGHDLKYNNNAYYVSKHFHCLLIVRLAVLMNQIECASLYLMRCIDFSTFSEGYWLSSDKKILT